MALSTSKLSCRLKTPFPNKLQLQAGRSKAFTISPLASTSCPQFASFSSSVTSADVYSSYKPTDPKTLDFKSLPFNFVNTKGMVVFSYKNGQWNKTPTISAPFFTLHAMSNALHYGQACFEGLKAFRAKDGNVYAFNPVENSNRLNVTANRLLMPEVDREIFLKGVEECVKLNVDYMPPYGSGGSMYVRPLYFGHGEQLSVVAAPEYTFAVIVSPVGPYYPTGLKPADAAVVSGYDRAAPKGVGGVKVAGNYAADLKPSKERTKSGFPISLYLDAQERKFVEEFSTSNFIAISKDKKTYVTPKSESILPSITNKMLQKLAEKNGLKVEQRKVEFAEIERGEFSEVAACGTAVIVTPVKSITYNGKKIPIGKGDGKDNEVLNKLYKHITGIQYGELDDPFNWRYLVCKK